MPVNKPAKVQITETAKNKAVGVAVTDNTGHRVHGVESLLGTDATKGALKAAEKRVLEETQKFAEGMDNIKKKKNQPVVEVKSENTNTGPKMR